MLQPIETTYKNVKFRSRLEARWAVYFTVCEIEWRYEEEGFSLQVDGRREAYLPDFYLPQVACFAEVKPGIFTGDQRALCRALARSADKPVLLLEGPPAVRFYYGFDPWLLKQPDNDGLTDFQIDTQYLDECRFYSSSGEGNYPVAVPIEHNAQIEAAVRAALSERFERRAAAWAS